ncbi:Glucomannan 4-beta-mannosyltransferase 9 [Abeliophyllum distichum]|uniref:Glucomannan 4-beta-mannosyltransferase 9 n=1 Tax=Abeliophyllum distichum TaxID=126358 RepID=A0ABD1VAN4_9LAMI
MRHIVFQDPDVNETYDATRSLSNLWESIRVPIIAPILRIAVYICIAMSAMLFVERVYMAIVITCVKFFGKKRYTKYQLDSIKEDLEKNKNYPTVLVQIPMYNEKEVYKLSIGAVCGLSWPSDRLIVQVLDDSTNEALRAMVELECRKWMENGVNVKYETRNNRNGYKADFQPEEDFLWRTIPYLLENPELGLVQARWKFVNADECLMTRLQQMSLDYHFSVEQEVGSSTCSFFGFNGTAGVWRIQAINDAGGWKDRTTVEDMDLAVRAGLKGWKFLFVGDLEVKNELPSTFKAYRSKAAIIGLLEANRVNEWIVTEKLGNTMKQKFSAKAARRPRSHIRERYNVQYLLHKHHFIILLINEEDFEDDAEEPSANFTDSEDDVNDDDFLYGRNDQDRIANKLRGVHGELTEIMIEISGDHQYGLLWSFAEELLSTNLGSTCRIAIHEGKFQEIYICLNACKKGFVSSCRQLVGLNGCFLKGTFGGSNVGWSST